MLKRIRNRNTLDAAIRAIGDYLTGSALAPGDRLPTEMELAARLGISRTILREALRHYRTLGILSSRPKVGCVVERLLPDDPYKAYRPFISADGNALAEIGEMRLCFERGAAELLVGRASPADFTALEEIVGRMENAAPDDLAPLDVEFHSRLLRITGNRMIGTLIPLLTEFFRLQRPAGTPETAEVIRRNAECHKELLRILKRGDAAEFREAITRHIMPPGSSAEELFSTASGEEPPRAQSPSKGGATAEANEKALPGGRKSMDSALPGV